MAGERDCSSDSGSNYEISEKADLDEPGNVDPADGLPTICVICEKAFKDPVVTLCKHYFCERCALTNYVNDQKCFVCGSETKGSFNTASNLEAKLKAQAKAQPLESPEDEDAKVLDKFAKQQQKAKEGRFTTQNGWIIP